MFSNSSLYVKSLKVMMFLANLLLRSLKCLGFHRNVSDLYLMSFYLLFDEMKINVQCALLCHGYQVLSYAYANFILILLLFK